MAQMNVQTNKTNFSIRPIKARTALMKTTIHNERAESSKGSFKEETNADHIDFRRVKYNELLYGEKDADHWKTIASKISGEELNDASKVQKKDLRYSDGTKVRSNAIIAFECEIAFPGNCIWSKFDGDKIIPVEKEEVENLSIEEMEKMDFFLWPENMEEFHEWEKCTLDFAKARMGEQNVLQAQAHLDETKPHMHIICSPFYETTKHVQKLSMTQLNLNRLEDLSTLQTDYADSVAHLGYQRGEHYSINVSNTSLSTARFLLTQSLNASLPDPKPGQTLEEYKKTVNDMYVKALVQLEEANLRNQNIKSTSKTIQKMLENNKTLTEENKSLKKQIDEKEEEIVNLKRENQKANKKLRREEYLRRGMEMHPDQEMIQTIYKPLTESLVEAGYQDLLEKGFIIDKDNDGIDDRLEDYDKDKNGIDDRLEGKA